MTDDTTIKAPKLEHAAKCAYTDCAGECCMPNECANQPSTVVYVPVVLPDDHRVKRQVEQVLNRWRSGVSRRCTGRPRASGMEFGRRFAWR